MGAMITEVDLNGKKLEDVVADWVNKNEGRWSDWVK
jgi:glycine betaine/proline transport system substrate-binding protein